MERRVAIHHLSKSKSSQVEEFPFKHFKELNIGRDPSCEIKFDPDQDDLISRRHAKIVIEKEEPPEFSISDLGSRNGTFVNKQRIFGPVKLNPGDLVQLGAGGPEFRFEVDPPVEGAVKPTRLAASDAVLAPTRDAPSGAPPSTGLPAAQKQGIGKATVERMIADTKTQTRRNMMIGAAAVLVLFAGVAAFVALRPAKHETKTFLITGKRTDKTHSEIAKEFESSVVLVEVAWKMVSMQTGTQMYQLYLQNAQEVKGRLVKRWDELEGGAYYPAFYQLSDGNLEPVLTTSDHEGHNRAIGVIASGSGFVISSDGFILTNRHVAAGWNTGYHWREPAGLKFAPVIDKKGRRGQAWIPIPASEFPRPWIPADAKLLCRDPACNDMYDLHPLTSGKLVDGRNDYLEVTFAGDRIRIPAKLARYSDHADVAMIKIELPRSVHATELNDNYDSIAAGDSVTVMGYPGASPAVLGSVGSVDPLGRQASWKEIPVPTLSTGVIARLVRGASGQQGEATVSTFGDTYQLTVNTTGSGNSGGPVFDDHAKVIGLFTYAGGGGPGEPYISFAVPIRYGMELMGVGQK